VVAVLRRLCNDNGSTSLLPPSAFASTFVIPLFPQACSSEKVRKPFGKVAGIVVALEQTKCFAVDRSRRILKSLSVLAEET
jgi:hypothetical protein